MNVDDLFKASFGQFGSVYLTGNGALLDLDGSSANRFVISITMLSDVTFQHMKTLDGLVSSISSVDGEDETADAFGSLHDSGGDGTDSALKITASHTFPKGVTIYGKWDYIELNGGSCICYLAPVGY